MTIRVVLADDHTLFLDGIAALLDQDPDVLVVGKAKDGADAVERVRESRPDVVVLDVSMPRLNGLEATRQIMREMPDTRVICLTMHGTPEFVVPALQRGAKGYLLKECAAEELVQAIHLVSAGSTYLSQAVAGAVVHGLVSPGSGDGPDRFGLTTREVEVLQLIAEGHKTREVAQRLNVSVKTVAAHRANIMEKTGTRGTAELTHFAIAHGIVPLHSTTPDDATHPSPGG